MKKYKSFLEELSLMDKAKNQIADKVATKEEASKPDSVKKNEPIENKPNEEIANTYTDQILKLENQKKVIQTTIEGLNKQIAATTKNPNADKKTVDGLRDQIKYLQDKIKGFDDLIANAKESQAKVKSESEK